MVRLHGRVLCTSSCTTTRDKAAIDSVLHASINASASNVSWFAHRQVPPTEVGSSQAATLEPVEHRAPREPPSAVALPGRPAVRQDFRDDRNEPRVTTAWHRDVPLQRHRGLDGPPATPRSG